YNIRVNSIHPGPIDTMMLHQVPGFEADSDRFLRNTPLRRAADPSEVAYLALYLASDESSFSTGAEFIVDGGGLA
ncbi:MAG: SDR family oxidoreductase, partial [Chloroflexi bacterium]|nr:SDR family oxidoreductase [Chloroflexota bacterium]